MPSKKEIVCPNDLFVVWQQ